MRTLKDIATATGADTVAIDGKCHPGEKMIAEFTASTGWIVLRCGICREPCFSVHLAEDLAVANDDTIATDEARAMAERFGVVCPLIADDGRTCRLPFAHENTPCRSDGVSRLLDVPLAPAPPKAPFLKDQPSPKTNEGPSIWGILIAEFAALNPQPDPILHAAVLNTMREREALGIERCGTPLQPFNGRDAAVDGLQEALDLLAYARQGVEEGRAIMQRAMRNVLELRAYLLDRDGQ